MHFYNENDPRAAQWLRELIAAGEIPDGVVDERSILDVQPADVAGFVQCHFFAGIGGWSLALKLAGWPEDRPIWTGSCPCPPFSAAGKKKKCPQCGGKTIPHPLKTGIFACVPCGHEWFADARHLWPEFYRLIRDGNPQLVIGEQVAGADGLIWLAGVRATLEALGHGVGAADTCAAGVAAPHIRQRLYWVADAASIRRHEQRGAEGVEIQGQCAQREGQQPEPKHAGELPGRPEGLCGDGGVVQSDCTGREPREQATTPSRHRGSIEPAGGDGGMGDTHEPGSQGWIISGDGTGERTAGPAGLGFWDDYELIPCADGKARRIKSGLQPLAHGVPGRVGLLRGAGNAIVPQVAAQFIKAVMDLKGGENHAQEAKKEKVRRLLTAGSSSA